MQHGWTWKILPGAMLSVLLVGCGSSADGVRSPAEVSSSAPSTVFLAVISSAADPNALEDDRAAVLDALGEDAATHVVVSPGGCFTGLPSRYGASYVLGILDADEDAARGEVADTGREAAWAGQVTDNCVD